VHCYIGLLSSLGEGDSSLFAEEIIVNKNAVVPTLLAYRGEAHEDLARCVLGLELLAHFIRAQNSSDYYGILSDYSQQAYDPRPLNMEIHRSRSGLRRSA
jgi:hypothetical protein